MAIWNNQRVHLPKFINSPEQRMFFFTAVIIFRIIWEVRMFPKGRLRCCSVLLPIFDCSKRIWFVGNRHSWLVISNIVYFSISYMGCHPSHWLIFFKMVIAPPSRWEMLESSHLIEDKNPMYCGPFFIFPYIGNSNPNWRTPSFFKRVIASPTSIAIEEHHFFNGWIIGLYQTGPCLQRAAKKKNQRLVTGWITHDGRPWW